MITEFPDMRLMVEKEQAKREAFNRKTTEMFNGVIRGATGNEEQNLDRDVETEEWQEEGQEEEQEQEVVETAADKMKRVRFEEMENTLKKMEETRKKYEKQIEDLKYSNMSETDRLKATLEATKNQLEEREKAFETQKLDAFKDKAIMHSQLDYRFKKFLNGADESEIDESVKELTNLIASFHGIEIEPQQQQSQTELAEIRELLKQQQQPQLKRASKMSLDEFRALTGQ